MAWRGVSFGVCLMLLDLMDLSLKELVCIGRISGAPHSHQARWEKEFKKQTSHYTQTGKKAGFCCLSPKKSICRVAGKVGTEAEVVCVPSFSSDHLAWIGIFT